MANLPRIHTGSWRVGRKVGRTIYNDDILIGVMDTPELAEMVVNALNLFADMPMVQAPPGLTPNLNGDGTWYGALRDVPNGWQIRDEGDAWYGYDEFVGSDRQHMIHTAGSIIVQARPAPQPPTDVHGFTDAEHDALVDLVRRNPDRVRRLLVLGDNQETGEPCPERWRGWATDTSSPCQKPLGHDGAHGPAWTTADRPGGGEPCPCPIAHCMGENDPHPDCPKYRARPGGDD